MMAPVLARGEQIAAEARDRAVAEVAARAADALPGVTVQVEQSGVVLAGRGLARRMLLDPALRWIGSVVR